MHRVKYFALLIFAVAGIYLALPMMQAGDQQAASAITHSDSPFIISPLATGLRHPWGMDQLPTGEYLITERGGRLWLFNPQTGNKTQINGLPSIAAQGQGGLLDVLIHPDYANNGWIYLSLAAGDDFGIGTEVMRARLKDNALVNTEKIFELKPKTDSGYHFGSRLAFDDNGYLFISLGDRGDREEAQNLNNHMGTLIRLHDDGRIPTDNPFVGNKNAQPEIYSYGHRNIQGMTFDTKSKRLWTHEHGPQGGDELNLPQMGKNYGWPTITYGVNYVVGTQIGEGTHKEGMEQPVHYWVPSIAPSGMAVYSGNEFKEWNGDLLVGSLKFQLLARLKMNGEKVVSEHRYLKEELGRIRDIHIDSEGYILLLTDAAKGGLYKLSRR